MFCVNLKIIYFFKDVDMIKKGKMFFYVCSDYFFENEELKFLCNFLILIEELMKKVYFICFRFLLRNVKCRI